MSLSLFRPWNEMITANEQTAIHMFTYHIPQVPVGAAKHVAPTRALERHEWMTAALRSSGQRPGYTA